MADMSKIKICCKVASSLPNDSERIRIDSTNKLMYNSQWSKMSLRFSLSKDSLFTINNDEEKQRILTFREPRTNKCFIFLLENYQSVIKIIFFCSISWFHRSSNTNVPCPTSCWGIFSRAPWVHTLGWPQWEAHPQQRLVPSVARWAIPSGKCTGIHPGSLLTTYSVKAHADTIQHEATWTSRTLLPTASASASHLPD